MACFINKNRHQIVVLHRTMPPMRDHLQCEDTIVSVLKSDAQLNIFHFTAKNYVTVATK